MPLPRRSWSAWVPLWAVVAVAMVAVVGLVWTLGGFERRTDLLQVTAPGSPSRPVPMS